MKRVDSWLLLAPIAFAMACGDDNTAASASASESQDGTGTASQGTDSRGTDSQGTETADTEHMEGSRDGGSSSGTVSESVDDSTSGTDSQGSNSQSGVTSDTEGDTESDSESASSSSTTGGPIEPPPDDPPGEEDGFCEPPGIWRYCWTGSPATYLIGECYPGIQQCIAVDLDVGTWGDCENESGPSLDDCDGLDNDCDGETDEDLGSTNCGLGICNHDEPNCILGLENDCDPDQGAMFEICDGVDNDCDGDIDEGLGEDSITCGEGECEHTVTECEGVPLECDPFEGAISEVCDGLDNDCNGIEDEGLGQTTCGDGICEHTIENCIGGFPQICNPFEGAEDDEECNGLDDDCDGLVDEGFGFWTCGDLDCEVSIPQCVDGVPVPESDCVPDPGNTEICGDGEDQNCDGEDPPCTETFLVGTDTTQRPIDLVWAVDTSGSMVDEIAVVEQEINDFADALDAGGGSNALHLIADTGDETEPLEICVDTPLGTGTCGVDNPPRLFHYDTNGGGGRYVHSSNALGRVMQAHEFHWGPNLQTNSYIAYIVTTDDDGDDWFWDDGLAHAPFNDGIADGDNEPIDDCQSGTGFITDATTGNLCRWDAPGVGLDYTSLAFDWDQSGDGTDDFFGFVTWMENFFPALDVSDDWAYYSILGGTGSTVLSGADDAFEFGCPTRVEHGEEYVKLSLYTGVQDQMIQICAADWDLTGLADSILSNVPNDTYVLDGVPVGNCAAINPATITVIVNGIPMNPLDWSYDGPSCTLTINNNVPVVGDNVVIVYQNV